MRIDFPGIDPFLRIAECGGFRRAARAIQQMASVRAGLPAWLVRGGEVDLHSQVSINPTRARIVNTARERKETIERNETIRWLSIRYWQNFRKWITTKRGWAALKPQSSTRYAERIWFDSIRSFRDLLCPTQLRNCLNWDGRSRKSKRGDARSAQLRDPKYLILITAFNEAWQERNAGGGMNNCFKGEMPNSFPTASPKELKNSV